MVLRAGAALETGLKRVIPDCKIGRLLIQSNIRTGEPELHYCKLDKGKRGTLVDGSCNNLLLLKTIPQHESTPKTLHGWQN